MLGLTLGLTLFHDFFYYVEKGIHKSSLTTPPFTRKTKSIPRKHYSQKVLALTLGLTFFYESYFYYVEKEIHRSSLTFKRKTKSIPRKKVFTKGVSPNVRPNIFFHEFLKLCREGNSQKQPDLHKENQIRSARKEYSQKVLALMLGLTLGLTFLCMNISLFKPMKIVRRVHSFGGQANKEEQERMKSTLSNHKTDVQITFSFDKIDCSNEEAADFERVPKEWLPLKNNQIVSRCCCGKITLHDTDGAFRGAKSEARKRHTPVPPAVAVGTPVGVDCCKWREDISRSDRTSCIGRRDFRQEEWSG